jgi:predicted transcriptional regulator
VARPNILGETPKHLHIVLSYEDYQKLEILAARSGRSRSSFAREILKAYLDEREFNTDSPKYWSKEQIIAHRDEFHDGRFYPNSCEDCRTLRNG